MDSQAWGRSPADLGWPEVANGGGGGWFGQGLWQHPPAAAAASTAATTMTTYGSAANYPPGPGSGLSRESSRDDLTSMELDQVFDYEERFRVDRRKLELLILGRFEPIKETACDYFQRIGDETNTTVIWPSRLKVGAKSKKDPHIRIGGQEEGVATAKTMIIEHLDTKSRRVTIKMDVSYTDHSHIIGKGGNTIRRVMSETGCHIHFPDSNRSNPNEKSNQVSIAGREMDGVEKARARVRELTPLIFTFDLPIVSSVEANLDPNDPFLRAIQDQFNIQLMFRQKQKNFHTTMAVVKGCEWEAARVKEATLILVDHLCGGNSGGSTPTTPISTSTPSSSAAMGGQVFPVTMNLEISPVHHSVVVGKNNINLRIIMQRTNTTILFPDAADPNIPPIRKGSVSISGAIHNVYSARQQLVGSLPLVMMFDMPDGVDIIDSEVQKIGEELDVAISIKPKHRQGSKSVLIKAQERNGGAIYAARHRLLKIDDEEEVLVVADIPESYKVQSIPPHLLQSLGMSQKKTTGPHSPIVFPNAPAMIAPPVHSPAHFFGAAAAAAAPPPPFSPYVLPPQTPWAMSNAALSSGLPPNHPILQEYAKLVFYNISRLEQLEHQKKLAASSRGYDPNNNWLGSNSELNNTSSILKADPYQAANGLNSPPLHGNSPRNSSPVQDSGNLSNNLSKLDLNNTTEKMMHFSLRDDNDPAACGGGGADESRSSGIGTTSGNSSAHSNFSNLFFNKLSSDRRAPGCEMKTLQKQLDYDQKRLLASRAMQCKPTAPEPRTPTPSWSGLGFSNSMPENVIREKMAKKETLEPEDLESAFMSPPPPGPTSELAEQTWPFGNSAGTFDSLLNKASVVGASNKTNNGANAILPSDDLPTLLIKQGLAKYTDLFVRHEVDLQTFATLTEQDLREIGIQTFGARKKLLLLANKLKQAEDEKW